MYRPESTDPAVRFVGRSDIACRTANHNNNNLLLELAVTITLDDWSMAMQGKASSRTVAALLAEYKNPDSPLHGWVSEMGTLARTKLPSVERREFPPLLPEGDGETDTGRKNSAAAKKSRREKVAVSPIVQDYVQYLEGNASPAAMARIAVALDDPKSELSQTIREMCAHGSKGRAVNERVPTNGPSRIA